MPDPETFAVELTGLEAMGLCMALMTEEDISGGLSAPQRSAQAKVQAAAAEALEGLGPLG